jgi:hypothetical protein
MAHQCESSVDSDNRSSLPFLLYLILAVPLDYVLEKHDYGMLLTRVALLHLLEEIVCESK